MKIKQKTPHYQKEQPTNPTDNRSEGSDANPSVSNKFNMGLLLDDTVEEAQRELNETNSEYCNQIGFHLASVKLIC